MTLKLGYSPCPNDTFIFDALVNKKINTGGINFEPVLEDVQTLNEWAIEGKLDVSKISYGVLPLVLNEYLVLNAGGALGEGVGPLLISRKNIALGEIESKVVGIPGRNTTAHMIFSHAFPAAFKKEFLLFSDIEKAVLEERIDAGVIIHENRFTYQQKGLIKLMDLGEYWEQETKSPIPLGGIVIKRSIKDSMKQKVDDLIRNSVQYAFNNYPLITDYVKQHSQEMEESVMRQHIDLYVNDFSIALNENGKTAVYKLLNVYQEVNKMSLPEGQVFVDRD
jgi:1,4-dihydroxy-6-naphthoate synthase